MRLATLALASLILTSTPVLAQSATSPLSANATCAARLLKTGGAAEYKMVRQCEKARAPKAPASMVVARKPVIDGSNQAEGGGALTYIIGGFLAVAVGLGIYVAVDNGDDPTSP